MSRLPQRRVPHRSLVQLLAALLLLGGCATLKQCAYEGFNRDRWQQPERVLQSLRLKPGQEVADLGSGGGYFTFRLARLVGPTGKVYAVDIDPDMTALVARRAKEEGLDNVQVIVANPEDPLLPDSRVELILTVNTYHHLSDRVSYFSRLQKYLRPDGRVAIIDFDGRGWFAGLWSHHTPPQRIKSDMEQAGYVVEQEFDFLDRQSFIVFAKHESAKRSRSGTVPQGRPLRARPPARVPPPQTFTPDYASRKSVSRRVAQREPRLLRRTTHPVFAD